VSAPPIRYAQSDDVLAGSEIELTDRSLHELKGIPREWRLYGVA
jgi:hypothetical protein